MKLILTQEVDGLGVAGDVVDVKDGYGRNYLVPRNLAIRWTKGGERQVQQIQRARQARVVRDNEHAQELKTQLEGLSVAVPARAGEGKKLFGSVGQREIADAIRASGGPLVDRRAIVLKHPIKTVGKHTVELKLHADTVAEVTLDVVPA